MVYGIFYSGFKAAIVSAKLDLIRQYYPDYHTVAEYGDDKIKEILSDPKMIKNKRKVQAYVDNARTFKSIVSENGSFQTYIDSFVPTASFENLMLWERQMGQPWKVENMVTV